MRKDALERAIELVGGQVPLAAAIGADQPKISFWLNRAKHGVPPQFCIPIEAATQGEVQRWHLRPDIYPEPSEVVPAQRVA